MDRRKKGEASPPAKDLLAPTPNSRRDVSALLINSNFSPDECQFLTLYLFRLDRRVVAWSLGRVPPDPGDLSYDSLLRIPIALNGEVPKWKAFVWYQRESINAAMRRYGNEVPKKVPRC